MSVNSVMDYSDPPRRQRPSRYPGLAPYEARSVPTGRPPWDDEPSPASNGAYTDAFNGAPTDASNDAFSGGFTDALGGTSTGGYRQAQSPGGFGQASSAGGFGQTSSTGGFGQTQSTDAFRQAQSTGGFGQAESTGAYRQARSTGEYYQAPPSGRFSQADTSIDDLRPAAAERRSSRPGVLELVAGGVIGFLAAALAIGVANLMAAFVRPQASPIIAVGGAFIDRTPPALKNFAVQKFGENDKNMLLLGMYVTIALIAIVIGMLAWRRVYIGVAGIGLFGLFGAFVAFTRPESHVTDVIPSIVGGIVGIAAIVWLISTANQLTGDRQRSSATPPSYAERSWAA